MVTVNQIVAYYNFEGQTVVGIVRKIQGTETVSLTVTKRGRGTENISYVKQGLKHGCYLAHTYSPLHERR